MKNLLIIFSLLLLSSFLTSCTQPNGTKYVGEYKDGKRHGQGTFTHTDGGKFVGEWKDDKPNGQGTFTHYTGKKYVGEWKDGKPNGQGTTTFLDGGKYVGEYKDGRMNGQGTFTHGKGKYEGQKYVGEYKDDKRWNGIYYDKNENGNIIVKFVNGVKQVDLTKEHKIPEPDATKESQSLLVIPFSVDYPTNFGTPVKGWGIKFNSRMNKTISFDPKFRQDYLVVEMEPGDYIGSKFIHPDYEGNDYIYGSYPRNRKDLDKSKRKNLRHLSFKLVNKNIKIADFRFTYWQQLGNDGGCCSYYGIIESIDDMVKNRTLDKISKLENFEKWKFDGKVQPNEIPVVKLSGYTSHSAPATSNVFVLKEISSNICDPEYASGSWSKFDICITSLEFSKGDIVTFGHSKEEYEIREAKVLKKSESGNIEDGYIYMEKEWAIRVLYKGTEFKITQKPFHLILSGDGNIQGIVLNKAVGFIISPGMSVRRVR